MSHLKEFKIVSDIQLGFRKSHSCGTQLRITLEDLAKNLDHGKQSDINLLDFAKAFDNVPHQRLLLKLSYYAYRTQSTSAFKLGRLKNSLVSSLNVNTWELSFSFFRTDLSCVNTVRWVKGGAGGGGAYARYHGHRKIEITHHSD